MQVRPLPSTPPRRSSVERAPPSEGGSRTFESCRRDARKGSGRMRGPLAKRVRAIACVGSSPTPSSWWKRPGWMRSLSRKQVGVARPLGVRVAPLPLHAAVVQRSRRRALNPEAGVQFPVAVRQSMPGGPAARTSGCYPEDESSTPSLAAAARWPSIQAHGCRPWHGGESPSRASIAKRTWPSFNGTGPRRAMPGMRVRFPPATPRGVESTTAPPL